MNALHRILAAAGAATLLAILFGGAPGEWDDPYLDVLLEYRESVPVAPEVLLMPMEDPGQPESLLQPAPVDLLWTLTELGAERVLLPPSWSSAAAPVPSRSSPSATGFSRRVDREFDRIDENIAALFAAIRTGAIDPAEAERFVDELRRLVAESKTRIHEDAGDGVDTHLASLENLIGIPGDGRVGTEPADLGAVLPSSPSAMARPILPGGGDNPADFRRLPAAAIGRYIARAHRMDENLAALEDEGFFDEVDPAERPRALQARVRTLYGEVSAHPTLAGFEAWRGAVDGYYEAAGSLIDGEAQARLTARFDALEGATEGLEEETAAQIREMRREVEAAFTSIRADHLAFAETRRELSDAVAGSFVVIQDGTGTGDDERVAAVNSALVGEHLRVPVGLTRVALLAAIGLLVGVLLAPFSFRAAIALAPAGLLGGAMVFPALFLVGDVWVEPASALWTVVVATAAALAVAGLFARRAERILAGRGAYRLPPRWMRHVTRRGNLPRTETGRRLAVAVVVAPEGKDGSRGVDLPAFHREISRRIRQLGGVVLGEERLTVIAALPAPGPDGPGFATAPAAADTRLAAHACAVVRELTAKPLPGGVVIRCGVEVGELYFYLSPIGGYRASGRALGYARRFCDLARTHRSRALFGDNVVAACGPGGDARRFQEAGQLSLPNAEGGYPFYRLTETDLPSP